MSAFIDFGALKKFIMERTEALSEGLEYTTKGDTKMSKLSDKGRALVKFLRDHTVDNYYQPMSELLEALLGEPISMLVKTKPCDYPGAAVVPLSKTYGANFPVGEVFLIINNDNGIKKSGDIANKYSDKKEDMRPATEEEVDDFLEEFKRSKNITKVLQYF